MTLSILAHDEKTGAIGGAAATGNLAVGSWVLRVSLNAGAVATQGYSVSPLWGDQALEKLHQNQAPAEILKTLTSADEGRAYRQLSILDTQSRTAVWTGENNTAVCAEVCGQGYIVAGNWLVSQSVVEQVAETFETLRAQQPDALLSQRLLDALQAGLDEGGDSRGTQSAAVRVVDPATPPLDLRVDFDQYPMAKLREIHTKATSPPYSDWMHQVPTMNEPYRF